jgi:hypothetical protein
MNESFKKKIFCRVKIMKNLFSLLLLLHISSLLNAQTLDLPPRPAGALTGSEFAQLVWDFSLTDRENEIYAQIMSGNIPDFQRNLVPINFNQTVGGVNYQVIYYVLPDYVAVGSDTNYFLIPMTPILAQKLCNNLQCTVPTRKMVDQIWSNATVKLAPAPISPSPAMTTVPVFWEHNQIVWQQRQAVIQSHPLGELVAGNKKDVVISNLIYGNPPPNRVVIYGWHYQNGTPIQPLYSGHSETYVDYSHGIRLVQDSITINGQPASIKSILQNDSLFILLSDEGRIPQPYYPLTTSINPPKAWCVISNDENSLKLKIHNDPDATHYLVHLSTNGINFPNSVLLEKHNLVINGLHNDSVYYIRLQAVGTDTSSFSEVLAGIPDHTGKKVLIVNGFDRPYAGNTRDFIRMHASAVKNYGYNFESSSNEAVTYGLINLNEYDIVSWILGTESTVDETFSTSEQSYVSLFLQNGGAFFVSGSEIAWDLDNRGSASDKNFFWNYLKSEYIADAPNNQSNTYYTAEGITGSVFEEITSINFDNGTHGTYNVSWPDVINGKNGGINVLNYSGLASLNAAGVVYKGFFSGGTTNGGLVYFGFPFETIYPESKRFDVMNKVLEFLSDLTDISDNTNYLPQEYILYQNYPNPFNPSTTISWQSPLGSHQTLKVYDLLGREVATLVDEYKEAGKYEAVFDASELSSGVYYYRLQTENYTAANKMIVIK